MRKLLCSALIFAVVLVAVTSLAGAVYVSISEEITVDGDLSDWANATILSWSSPYSKTEVNLFYILHSENSYFIGARIYDIDSVGDDSMDIYLNNTADTYRFELEEGEDSFNAYKLVNGTWNPVSVNASVVYTKSKVQNPYSYLEMSIPKELMNNSTTLLFYAEHTSPLPKSVYSKYPEAGDANNISTWEVLKFFAPGERALNLTILDREGVPA